MAALQYKDDHNRIAYLGRERGSEDFTDILSYLDHSPLRYALTHDPPVVFDSLVKQFWATATVRPNAAGSHDLVAAIDGREVVVTESLIRAQLQLDDANGIFDMQIDDIFAGMGAIGYPPGRTLTFLKHHLSPQWRFLVHTILHCLSPKAGSWNQFPSSIATALICLSTGRVYNFSRFILEGMIANVKATRHKFLMYPRFLQMLVAIETADRTPRPTFGFTRKLFSNMKLKWEGEAISLTPPMLAIAAAGNDAADEENVPAHAVAGSPAVAHPVPHPPPFSPVRETTPERQPETEWVVPNPVSPGTDWRPWPSVLAPRPPTPPAQTLSLEEPLVFGPVPKPAGYVDPDSIDPIIFGPPPRPYDFVDPALEESVIFGPLPRPANYIEPEDITNLNSMEDETILGGFHEETHAGPDDAPTPTADAAGRAEDPALLTSLSAKIDRCMGRIDSLETELGTSKKIMGGAILTLVSRVKKLERTVKQLRTARLVGDAPATEGDVDIQDEVDLEGLSRMASEALGHDQATVPSEDMEEREEEEVPLRRKRSVYRRARTEFHAPRSTDVLPQADISESAGPSVGADKGKAPMPDLEIPAEFLAEDAQARQRLEEEQASARLVQQLQAEDLAQADVPLVSEQRAKELDELLLRMTDTDWLTLMMQVGTNPALARELLGADVNEDNFIERMTAIKERKKRALADLRYRALKGKPLKHSEVTQMMRTLVKNQWCAAHNGTITMKAVKAMSKQQLIEEYENICRCLEKDRLLSAQYNLFRPKPAITEPPSKRQRVERDSSQPSTVPAATTQPADDHDSAGGSSFHPAGSAPPMSGSAVPDTAGGPLDTTGMIPIFYFAAMDSAASHHELEISPFADSDDCFPVTGSTDHLPIDVLLRFFFRGVTMFCVVCGCGQNPDDEIVDSRMWMLVWLSGGMLIVVSVPSFLLLWKIFGEHKMNGCEWLEVISQTPVHDVTPQAPRYTLILWDVVCCMEVLLKRIQDGSAGIPMSVLPLLLYLVTIAKALCVPKIRDGCQEPKDTCPDQRYQVKAISYPLMAVMVCPTPYGIQLTMFKVLRVELVLTLTMDIHFMVAKELNTPELLLRDVAASFDSAVHRDHAGSFDAAVPSLVSAACVAAAAYFVPAVFQSSCFEKIYLETCSSNVPADYVSAGYVEDIEEREEAEVPLRRKRSVRRRARTEFYTLVLSH
ncbi:hypothetical protein Tco_0730262 [Tanacetum coccineum]|uniref:Synaptobrevin, longin-like domain protein n=1 Tax=Tanacetum coccineum TaxID=301880 RepID=A0ABQ4YSH8_9ASTR